MNIKPFFVLTLILLFTNCNTPQPKNTLDKVAKQESIKDTDTIPVLETAIQEIVVRETAVVSNDERKDSLSKQFEDFLIRRHNRKFSVTIDEFFQMPLVSEEQSFINQENYKDSLPFYPNNLLCLLLDHFQPKASFDSLFFEPSGMYIIGYQLTFENGIVFEYTELESGGEVNCIIPTTNDVLLRSFLSKVYYEKDLDASWDSDTTYQPIDGGAGCYIDLKKVAGYISFSVYCGC